MLMSAKSKPTQCRYFKDFDESKYVCIDAMLLTFQSPIDLQKARLQNIPPPSQVKLIYHCTFLVL